MVSIHQNCVWNKNDQLQNSSLSLGESFETGWFQCNFADIIDDLGICATEKFKYILSKNAYYVKGCYISECIRNKWASLSPASTLKKLNIKKCEHYMIRHRSLTFKS